MHHIFPLWAESTHTLLSTFNVFARKNDVLVDDRQRQGNVLSVSFCDTTNEPKSMVKKTVVGIHATGGFCNGDGIVMMLIAAALNKRLL